MRAYDAVSCPLVGCSSVRRNAISFPFVSPHDLLILPFAFAVEIKWLPCFSLSISRTCTCLPSSRHLYTLPLPSFFAVFRLSSLLSLSNCFCLMPLALVRPCPCLCSHPFPLPTPPRRCQVGRRRRAGVPFFSDTALQGLAHLQAGRAPFLLHNHLAHLPETACAVRRRLLHLLGGEDAAHSLTVSRLPQGRTALDSISEVHVAQVLLEVRPEALDGVQVRRLRRDPPQLHAARLLVQSYAL